MADDAPPLVIAPESQHFGDVWENEAFSWTIRVTNTSESEVHVNKVLTSCTCTSGETGSFVLSPGDTRDIKLTLDLSHTRTPRGVAVEPFEVSVGAALHPHGERPPIWWKVRGRVRRAVGLDAVKIDFGHKSEFAQPLRPVTRTVDSATPLARLEASDTSGRFRVSTTAADDSGLRFDLLVTPLQVLPIGAFRGEIRLRPVTRNGETLPDRRATVRGEIGDDIQISPPAVTLGARSVGDPAEETLSLTSQTGARSASSPSRPTVPASRRRRLGRVTAPA